MKFNTKALALASAILWGLVMLLVSLGNLIWGNYGQQFLQTMSSVYPTAPRLPSRGSIKAAPHNSSAQDVLSGRSSSDRVPTSYVN